NLERIDPSLPAREPGTGWRGGGTNASTHPAGGKYVGMVGWSSIRVPAPNDAPDQRSRADPAAIRTGLGAESLSDGPAGDCGTLTGQRATRETPGRASAL